MKAIDVHKHFVGIAPWNNWDDTTDGIKAGDPEREIKSMAVCWKSTFPQLRKARELGCDFFLSHEATFLKGDRGLETPVAIPQEAEKLKFLEETGMAVYRCHDVWDLMPYHGVKDSWARRLGFGGAALNSSKYYSVFQVPPSTVEAQAKRILELTRPLGQRALKIVGDPGKTITKLALGTGASTDVLEAMSLGAEAAVLSDDFMAICRIGSLAIDADFPLIIVNHATSEEWGIMELAAHCRREFKELEVHFLPQGCQYETVL